MAKDYCVIVPSKGADLFLALKKDYGYSIAKQVFLKAINPSFIENYKKKLTLDKEGVPTKDSLLSIPYIKNLLGNKVQLQAINKRFKPLEDTIENFNIALEEAKRFNEENENFIATVENIDGKLKIVAQERTEDTVSRFNNQYSSLKLNQVLSEMFGDLGITIGALTEEEIRAGRIGVTDFNVARRIAQGFSSIIRVANNKEGAMALPEEFSHLIIGALQDNPLVQRALNSLRNEETLKRVLGDQFEDTMEFQDGNLDRVAEEALGQILRDNLIRETTLDKVKSPNLFRRLINYIKNLFKGRSNLDVDNAISEADSSMGRLAKDILKGAVKITEQDIARANREAVFNSLSERIDRNIEILKQAAKIEIKRGKLSQSDPEESELAVDRILEFAGKDKDTVLGILNYAKEALYELKDIDLAFLNKDTLDLVTVLQLLKKTRLYLQSYAPTIKALTDAYNEEARELDNMFRKEFITPDPLNGDTPYTLESIYKELLTLSSRLQGRFDRAIMEALTEFYRPFFGEDIVVPFGKHKGEIMSIENVMKEASSDISFLDRWLDSMAESSDILLQLVDSVVKKEKDSARLEAITYIKEIQNLMLEAESLGIKNFEWMFERGSDGNMSGNYISDINFAQFNKELNEMEASLEAKYGKNPRGEEAKRKLAERREWVRTHAFETTKGLAPQADVYRNNEFYQLTENQRSILSKYLELKESFDEMAIGRKIPTLRAIQIRKDSSERIIKSITNPSKLWENIKNATAETFLEQEDDEDIFGEKESRGITDFSGREFRVMPFLYARKLKNPNELSTDVFGALMAYAFSSTTYRHMDNIIDPLELTRALVLDEQRKVRETRGDNPLVERIETESTKVINKIFKSGSSNIADKLEDYLDTQIYLRYLKDSGTFDFLGKKVSKDKTVSALLKLSSTVQLGFNWLANIANVGTGVGMQNIEAIAGEYFGIRELASADKAYVEELTRLIPELGSRIKTNKLDLFGELFNIKQTFNRDVKRVQKKNILQRIFGSHVQFLGQECGDHWLYYRTAIAMSKRTKVKVPGKGVMSLWDALEIQDVFEGNTQIKEMVLPKGTTYENGEPFDVGSFGRKIADVNHGLFGIYNDDDRVAAERIAGGRLLLMYRKWMKPQYNKRFKPGQQNLITGQYEEGYYRTFFRMMNELVRGKVQLSAQWAEMTDHEKANIKRALGEWVQLLAVWILADLIDWPDDEDRWWIAKLAEYMAKRELHELGGLAPSPMMGNEILKTVKSPSAAINTVQSIFNVSMSLIDPRDWNDEMKSGPYKGMSTLEKNLLKSPFPIVAQYKQIDKFVGDLDTSINYYMRPW